MRWRSLREHEEGGVLYNCDSARRFSVELRGGWRVGRVAEGGGLLNRCRTKSSTGGSNPPLSAIKSKLFRCATYRIRSSPIWQPNRAFVFLRRISAGGGERQNQRLSHIRRMVTERGISQVLYRQFDSESTREGDSNTLFLSVFSMKTIPRESDGTRPAPIGWLCRFLC
jgi:hypothetical protein